MTNLSGIPPIHCLAAFEAAARLGSFERAADELAVSQSAVSHRVRSLEKQLGRRLFERRDRGVRLTLAGHEYLEVVRGALRGLAEYSGHRRSRRRQKALRVGVPPAFAREVLVPCVGEFNARHPEVSLELVVSIPFQEVQDGDTDLDVRFGSGDYDDGAATLLLNEPMFPVCTPDYAQRTKLEAPQDLARAVLLRCPLDPWKPWFEAARLDWPEPGSGPRFNDAGMMMEAALAGQGVALGTPRLVARWLRSGALRRLFEIEAACPYSYFIVRRHKAEAAEAGLFVDWLGELVGRNPVREPAAAQTKKTLRAV
jgi:LysR family glycine cleavage system transcriptional activator